MAGHIEKNNRGTYTIVLELGTDIYGKRIRKKVTYKTAAEAKRALNEYENQMNKGTFVVPNDISFGEWIKYWEENYARNECEENTYEEYCRTDKKYIIPCLGHIPLQSLNQIMLDEYYKYLHSERKLSVSTIKKHHSNISSALTFAMKKGKLSQNVASLATIPKPKKEEKFEGSSYDQFQAKKLLSLFINTDIECAVALSIFLGLSRGELCGLKIDKVFLFDDNKKDYLLIEETRVRGIKKIIVKDPKAESRRRALYIPLIAKKVIEKQINWIDKNRQTLKNNFIESGYLLVKENGEPYPPGYISQKFKYVLDEYNKNVSDDNEKLPLIRLHDLRHTNITVLIEDDVNIYDVSKHAGHSNINTTMIYTHKFDENQKRIADKIDDIFS